MPTPTPPIEHIVFISYPRDIDIVRRFAKELHRELQAQLQLYDKGLKVFYDEKNEDLRRGTDWEDWITPALCRSATMVAVCPLSYFSSDGCTREFHGMKTLVDKRKQVLDSHCPEDFIFALLLIDEQMPDLSGYRTIDFRDYPQQTGGLSDKSRYKRQIHQLAREIWATWKALERKEAAALLEDARLCASFDLPPGTGTDLRDKYVLDAGRD